MIISPTSYQTLFSLLTSQRQMPFLTGAPGIGKTTVIRDLEKLNATPECLPDGFESIKVFILAVNECAIKDDMVSRRIYPHDDGSFSSVFVFHPVIEQALSFAQNNEKVMVVLALDEINRGSVELTTVPMAMSASRRIGDIDWPSNLYLVATGNDEGAVVPLDDAAMNRMVVLPSEASYDQWMLYMVSSGKLPHPVLTSTLMAQPRPALSDPHNEHVAQRFVRKRQENIFGSTMNQITSPRALTNLAAFLQSLTDEQIQQMKSSPSTVYRDQSLLTEMILGFLGTTKTAEAIVNAFIREDIKSLTPISLPLASDRPSIARVARVLQSVNERLASDQISEQERACYTPAQLADIAAHALTFDAFYTDDHEVDPNFADDYRTLLEALEVYIQHTDRQTLIDSIENSLYNKSPERCDLALDQIAQL